METVTHLLLSLAVYRAGLRQMTPLALPILLLAGLAADVDALAALGSVEQYLDWRYTATHSLVAAAAIALIVALPFWLIWRNSERRRVRLGGALVAGLAGAVAHLALDVAGTQGVQLLWPWGPRRFALEILDYIDPWIVGVLLLGLLLPVLFRLVSEEVGARPAAQGPQRGAIVALIVVLLYAGGRYVAHQRAVEVLDSSTYRGAPALRVGAFPSAVNPLVWYGIVETDYTFELLEVQLTRATRFDPGRSQAVFKPETSVALEAAQRTPAVQRMVEVARFPSAMVVRARDGHRVTVEDLRHGAALVRRRSFYAQVEVDETGVVTSQELKWGAVQRRR